jgi:hypothetical protein
MPQSILVFDFGRNEEAAQQARHKFEGWKQAFRLGDKAVLKFERKSNEMSSAEGSAQAKAEESAKATPAAKKRAKKKSAEAEVEKKAEESATENSEVRILIRLNFSDHEKLSYQRWLDRIPSEEPFKLAKNETLHHSDPSFAETADLFDSLDRSPRRNLR